MNPVRTLEGLNHMSFTTGQPPPSPSLKDLPPEIEGPEARRIIVDDCLFFIDFCIKLKQEEDVSEHLEKLSEWLDYQAIIYDPLIRASDMEVSRDKTESPWVKEAQRIIAEAYEPEVVVHNYAMDQSDLVSSRPSLTKIGEEVLANTTVNVRTDLPWSSALMLQAKLSSREMFDEVLGRVPSVNPQPTCRDVNMAAWDLVYSTITDLAKRRYETRDYKINFKEDVQQVWGPGWVLSEIEFSSDGSTLNITSSSLITSPSLGGAHYCKILSPFRAIEFFYVDSLRLIGFVP